MKITYLGHACFKLEFGEFSLITDPYQNGKIPGLGNLNEKADVVLCSHSHDDHNAHNVIDVTNRATPFDVSFFDTYHDDVQGAKRGMNKVHIITAEGLKIVHMGDIGCELTTEQIKLLSGADLVMIPVGGFYTIDANQAFEMAEQIGAKTVIPMHYRKDNIGFAEIATVDAFTQKFEEVTSVDSEYILNGDKVVVMTPKYKE